MSDRQAGGERLATSAEEAVTGIAWRPDTATVARSPLTRLIQRMGCTDYPDLLAAVERDPEQYWRVALNDLDLRWQRPFGAVWDLDRGIAWPRWFPGAAFNVVESAVDRWVDAGDRDRTAIVAEADDGAVTRMTFVELQRDTDRLARALLAEGIVAGDSVGILLPMIAETAVAMLACARIGAVTVPLFSGFGDDAIASRLRDAAATALITVDGFHRRGKPVPVKATVDRALEAAPGMTRCVVLRRAGGDCPMREGRDRWWHDLVAGDHPPLPTTETTADAPLMLMYTSGTTGRPKGAEHIHAGFPIKAAHDLAYCFDVQRGDVLFWLTDLGWMMGPWLILGGLLRGATVVMLEGTPDHPTAGRMWEMVERHRVTVLGLAPTAVRALIPAGEDPVRRSDRSSLRVLGSTGETWNPDPWWWLFDMVGERRCPIINYSGGTETSGGIVSGVTVAPQRACAFTGPVPGMVADVVDGAGRPMREGVGELVVRAPWVGMTCGFRNDPERYEATYWERLPGMWVHGDWAEVDADGFWYIRGRSDDTMNIAGKRLGPAEVESAAVAGGGVREAAAIAVPHPVKGSAIAVFVVPIDEGEVAGLGERVAESVARHLGRAFRPELVVTVEALPRTRNAKIMRRMIRAAWLGEDAGDATALENPEAMDAIRAARTEATRAREGGDDAD